MTDKEQIIIDGVDVKKCDFFLPSNKYCGLYSTGCRFVPNCHFKQLARKTQECEELKDARFNLNCEIYSLNRYRKALEEIENICVQDRDIKDVCLVSTCFESHRVMYDIQEEILNIINKAKGEENKQ